MTRQLLQEHLWIDQFDVGIYIVRSDRMAKINRAYLQHEGTTDVITFDYGDPAEGKSRAFQKNGTPDASESPTPAPFVHGEIFVCIDVAIEQARRFRTTWQSELVRYVIHGILHLMGYDDHAPADRRAMKRRENLLLKRVGASHPFAKLAVRPPRPGQ